MSNRACGNKRYYEKPLHSDSLAIAKSQVAEHKRRWPDIEIDSEFRPIFTNFRQHDNYLRDTGFCNLRPKNKNVGARRFRPVTDDSGRITMVEIGI